MSTNVGEIDLSLILNSNKFSSQLKNIDAQAEKASSKISATLLKIGKAAIAAFSVAKIVKFGETCVEVATETSNAWIGLNSILTGQGKSFSQAKSFINEYIADGLVPLNNAVAAYKNLTLRGYNSEQIQKTMNALKNSATFARQSTYSLGDAVQTATEGLKNENSVIVDNAGVTKNVAQMWDDYAKSIGTTRDKLTQAQKIQAEVNGILQETKFQSNDATIYAQTYAGKLAQLNTAFTNMKTAIGNAIQPLAKLFIPIITGAVNAVTKLFTALSGLLALFGLKADSVETISNGMGSITEGADNASDAIGGIGDSASKSAKKAKKALSLAGFDEMNKLDDKSDSSSGGSGSSGAGRISDKMNGALSDTKSIVEDFTNTIESAFDFGYIIGQKINETLEKIPWRKVQSVLNEVTKGIAECLNGLVESINWVLIGNTFAQGLNTVIYIAKTFLETFDFRNLGQAMARTINGFFKNVDWKALANVFVLGLKSVFNTVTGFFETIDWNIIVDSIVEFFQNVDYSGIAESFSTMLGNAVGSIMNLGWIIGEKLNGVIDGIADYFAQYIEYEKSIGGNIIAGILDGIIDALIGIGNWVIEHIFTPFIEGFKNAFGIHSPSTVMAEMGQYIIQGLFEGITSLVDTIKEIWQKMKETIIEILNNLRNKVVEIVNNLKTSVIEKFTNIKTKAQEIWESIKSVVSEKINNLKTNISNTLNNIKTVWENIWNSLKTIVTNIWDGIWRSNQKRY